MISYIYNYFFPQEEKEEKKEEEKEVGGDFIIVKEYLHITANDLKSVNLLPSKERVMKIHHKNVNMQDLNKDQLKQIMNVKLKPVNFEKKKHTYKQRHPVLKELQEKITKK